MNKGLYIIITILLINCGSSNKLLTESQTKLSQPLVTVDSIFFFDSSKINFEHRLANSQIEESSAKNANVFTPIPSYGLMTLISNTFTFRASKTHHQSSDPITVSVFKLQPDLIPNSITSSVAANPEYCGNGIESLIDEKKSELHFRSGEWLGFDQDSIEIELSLKGNASASEVIISNLYNQNSWILPPSQVKVYSGERLLHSWLHSPFAKPLPSRFEYCRIPIPTENYSELKFVIFPSKLPEWHAGKGNNAWLFLDEILLN